MWRAPRYAACVVLALSSTPICAGPDDYVLLSDFRAVGTHALPEDAHQSLKSIADQTRSIRARTNVKCSPDGQSIVVYPDDDEVDSPALLWPHWQSPDRCISLGRARYCYFASSEYLVAITGGDETATRIHSLVDNGIDFVLESELSQVVVSRNGDWAAWNRSKDRLVVGRLEHNKAVVTRECDLPFEDVRKSEGGGLAWICDDSMLLVRGSCYSVSQGVTTVSSRAVVVNPKQCDIADMVPLPVPRLVLSSDEVIGAPRPQGTKWSIVGISVDQDGAVATNVTRSRIPSADTVVWISGSGELALCRKNSRMALTGTRSWVVAPVRDAGVPCPRVPDGADCVGWISSRRAKDG